MTGALATSTAAERAAFADALRRCLGSDLVRRDHLADGDAPGFDARTWEALNRQLGVSALVVPEAAGGAGARYSDLAVAFEALGASLACVPALSSAGMASGVLLGLNNASSLPLLSEIAEGSTVATVVWPEVDPAATLRAPTVRLVGGDAGAHVTGSGPFVVSGMEADLFLVPAVRDGALVLCTVAAAAPGVHRRSMTTLDLTRGMAEITFDAAPARLLAEGSAAADALATGMDAALAMIAMEQVGLSQRCLDSAVAYVKDRVQFDRPVGSFQAVKHTLVNLLLVHELARSAADLAVEAVDAHVADPRSESATRLRGAASMAKAMCGEAGTRIARETLHLFGGIGFTWEHDAHLYYRRALSNEQLLGNPAAHRVRLATAVGM